MRYAAAAVQKGRYAVVAVQTEAAEPKLKWSAHRWPAKKPGRRAAGTTRLRATQDGVSERHRGAARARMRAAT